MFPIFFLLLLLPTTAYSVQFQITQFDANTPDILYRGYAKPSQGQVDISDYESWGVGWTIYAKKVPIWDLDTGKLTDFSTRLSFTIDTMGKSIYGDGLAFFLAPLGFDIPPNSAGGNLGLFNHTTKYSPPHQIVFVEFDSHVNTKWDPNVTHVGINIRSLESAICTAWNASFHSGDIAVVWIIYNATTKNLSVSWTYQRTSNSLEHTSLSYQIDLMKVLPESVQIGFSAATSLVRERHILRSWEFNSSLDIKETSGKKVRKISLIVILTVVVVGVIVIASVMLWICKGKKKETTEIVNLTSINDALERGAGPRSLDSHLFGKRSPLSWVVRYKISLGLASALFYLHEEWEQCVVHRDIKSSNVMLDSSFNVKLGDFGLARLMDHELGPQTTGLAGTFGYMAPEYIRTGRASKESDVYSFGVVALEIATGKRSVDLMGPNSNMGLVEWIWNLYGRGDLLLAVDGKLQTNFDEKQVECLMIIGLWCAHPDPNLRPSIGQAIQVLKFEAKISILPMQMPTPMYPAPIQPLVSSGEPLLTNSLQQGC
ncbi:L-type lectin-domain containing receptor kinase IX.1-like [Fagus crenata]